MRKKLTKEKQDEISHIAWGRDIKLPVKEEKKKGEFKKNLKENLTKFKQGADKMAEGMFGKDEFDLPDDIDLFGNSKEEDIFGLNKLNFL